jgi:hypothetical protein
MPRHAARWSIPDLGIARPCLDRVEILSRESVGYLKTYLPIRRLQAVCHSLNVLSYRGPDPRLRSRIVITGTHTTRAWSLLAKHERLLGKYRVIKAELAYDVNATSVEDGRNQLFALVRVLDSSGRGRRRIRSFQKPDHDPPPGCVSEPTFYYGHRGASVALKCYVRRKKFSAGTFGPLCVRIEWTLTGARALKRHLGGNKLRHLVHPDLNGFLKRNLRLAKVDHAALYDLYCGKKIVGINSDGSSAKKQKKQKEKRMAALLLLRVHSYREEHRFASPEQARLVCQHSPTEIRAYFRDLRDGKRPTKLGRPNQKRGQLHRRITDYRINACFERIPLRPVNRRPGITISAKPKLPIKNTNKHAHSNIQIPLRTSTATSLVRTPITPKTPMVARTLSHARLRRSAPK